MKLLIVLSLLAFASAAVLKLGLEKTRNPLAGQKPLRANRIFNPKMKATISGEVTQYFTTNVSLGTPPQTFRMAVQTESADLTVFDSSCTKCQAFGAELVKFDSSKSSTYVKDGRAIKNMPGMRGFLGLDTMTLGRIGESQISVKGQIFGQIAEIDFTLSPFSDGTLGLGLPAAASEGFVPPLFNAINQGLLDEPVYTVWMNDMKLQPEGAIAGQVTYGGLDADHCGDVIAYHPLSSATLWQFRMKSVGVGGYSNNVGWEAQIQTHSEGLMGPMSIVDSMVAELGAKWNENHFQATVDCDAELKPIVLGIGSYKYQIDPMHYKHEMFGECHIELYGVEFGGFTPMWMVGQVFGYQYCGIFDVGQQRIGFAPTLQK